MCGFDRCSQRLTSRLGIGITATISAVVLFLVVKLSDFTAAVNPVAPLDSALASETGPKREGLAFAPTASSPQPGLPEKAAPQANPIPPAEGWEGVFLHGFGKDSPGVKEALAWLEYRDRLRREYELGEALSRQFSLLSFAPTDFTLHRFTIRLMDQPSRPLPPAAAAASVLSLRAAVQAMTAVPNHPDAYFAWYKVLAAVDLPLTTSERAIARVTALRACLSRFPPPEQYQRNQYVARPHEVAGALALMYFGEPNDKLPEPIGLPIDMPATAILWESNLSDGVTGLGEQDGELFSIPWRDRARFRNMVSGPSLRAIDLARDMAILAGKYAAIEFDPKADEQKLNQVNRLVKTIVEEADKTCKEYEGEKQTTKTKLPERVKSALRSHLVGEALILLNDKGTDLNKEYGPVDRVDILLIRAALELAAGRIEGVATDLKVLAELITSTPAPPNIRLFKQDQMNSLLFQKLCFEGNYRSAGQVLENHLSGRFEREPIPTLEEAVFNTDSFVALGSHERAVQLFQIAPPSPLAQLGREVLLSHLLLPYLQRQQKLSAFRMYAAEFAYQRGLLALLEGDTTTARKRFEQSRKPAVREWGVPAYANPTAVYYLRVIEEAEKKVKQK